MRFILFLLLFFGITAINAESVVQDKVLYDVEMTVDDASPPSIIPIVSDIEMVVPLKQQEQHFNYAYSSLHIEATAMIPVSTPSAIITEIKKDVIPPLICILHTNTYNKEDPQARPNTSEEISTSYWYLE